MRRTILFISLVLLFGSCTEFLGSFGPDKEGDNVSDEPLEIGQVYAGGIIYYLDGNGGGLVFAHEYDQDAIYPWSTGNYSTIGASSESVGGGAYNTAEIVDALGSGNYAANICDELVYKGYDDWFLPSIGDLEQIHEVKSSIYDNSDFVFYGVVYWSSTEYGESAYASNLSTSWWFDSRIVHKSGNSDVIGEVKILPVRSF